MGYKTLSEAYKDVQKNECIVMDKDKIHIISVEEMKKRIVPKKKTHYFVWKMKRVVADLCNYINYRI